MLWGLTKPSNKPPGFPILSIEKKRKKSSAIPVNAPNYVHKPLAPQRSKYPPLSSSNLTNHNSSDFHRRLIPLTQIQHLKLFPPFVIYPDNLPRWHRDLLSLDKIPEFPRLETLADFSLFLCSYCYHLRRLLAGQLLHLVTVTPLSTLRCNLRRRLSTNFMRTLRSCT